MWFWKEKTNHATLFDMPSSIKAAIETTAAVCRTFTTCAHSAAATRNTQRSCAEHASSIQVRFSIPALVATPSI